jgi:hypothetical protein
MSDMGATIGNKISSKLLATAGAIFTTLGAGKVLAGFNNYGKSTSKP